MKSPNALIMLFLFFLTFSVNAEVQEHSPERVSLLQLIVNSDDYHQKDVVVEGYLCVDKRYVGLYSSTEACRDQVTGLGVALKTDEELYIRREENGHLAKVIVRGRFHARQQDAVTIGGLNYNGAIDEASIAVKEESYRVTGYANGEVKRLIERLVSDWLDKVQDQDLKGVLDLMNVDPKGHVEEETRVTWLLFGSPKSIQRRFQPDSASIHVLELEENRESFNPAFGVCITVGVISTEKLFDMPLPGQMHNVACFLVYRKDRGEGEFIIDPVSFGEY